MHVAVQETLPPRLMTLEDAARYVGGMSRRGFQDFRKRWQIPDVKLSDQTIRIDVADLDRAINEAKAKSRAQHG